MARRERSPRPDDDPGVWRACFDAVLPYAPHTAEFPQAARAHALMILEQATGVVDLGARIYGEPRRILRGALTGWWMGWRTSVLADVLADTGLGFDHGEYTGTAPRGWLLPALGGIGGMLSRPGDSARYAKTVEEEIAWCNRPWAEDLDFIHGAHEGVLHVRALHLQTDRYEGLLAALRYVIDRQWRIEIESGYEGWDDACWYDYLEVHERVRWLAVALGYLHVHPETCGRTAFHVVYEATKATGNRYAMPDGVIEQMADAIAGEVWPAS